MSHDLAALRNAGTRLIPSPSLPLSHSILQLCLNIMRMPYILCQLKSVSVA